MSTSPRKLFGFTLLELLVVMAIIGILAAIGIASYGTVQSKARDARRKSDLENVARALEMYRNDVGNYPDAAELVFNGSVFKHPTATPDVIYMQKTPKETRGGYGYLYEPFDIGGTFKGYRLYARLENLEDAKVPHNPVTGAALIFSTDTPVDSENVCSQGCNYAISSTNVALTATEADD
jgi:general secretion pathway protein G